MDEIEDIREETTFDEYFVLVSEELANFGFEDEEIAEMIKIEAVSSICNAHFSDKANVVDAAEAVIDYWEKYYEDEK